MADNLGYTPGSGATVATDEVGGVHYQVIKPAFGADNEAQLVSAETPLPVAESGPLITLFVRMLNMLGAPVGYDKSLQRYRQTAVIESGTVTTVTTVTTVATVTNLTNITGNIGNYQANQQVFGQNQASWAALVRARII